MCTITKKEQRQIAKEKLNKMSYFDRSFKSEMIVDDIISSGILNTHSHILFYKAMDTEVNVDRLIDYCYSKGKSCYLPKVVGDEIKIVKLPCKLEKGAFGISEPVGEFSNDNVDLVITPVMAVDKNNNRLGKGKGYYDRFFAHNFNCFKVAVAFKEQQLDSIITEECDVKMDMVFVR